MYNHHHHQVVQTVSSCAVYTGEKVTITLVYRNIRLFF